MAKILIVDDDENATFLLESMLRGDRYEVFATNDSGQALEMASRIRPDLIILDRYRNISLFSIDYAFRPRLRYRLTLRRLALRRKPWVFGVRVFHPFLS